MNVRLLTRWGSHFQGDTVSVSVERAHALSEAGIGSILDSPAEPTKEAAAVDFEPEAEPPVEQPAEPTKGKNGKGKS